MKIGIDCRAILNPGFGENAGVGHYAYAIVEAMLRTDGANRYVLFFDENVTREAALKFVGDRKLVDIKFLPWHRYRRALPGIYEKIFLPAAFARERLDVLFSPSGEVPANYPGAVVATAHDLAAFRHPEWFSPKRAVAGGLSKSQFLSSMSRARRIIAVSNATKRDLIELARVPESKVDVVYEGVTPHRFIQLSNGETCSINEELCDEDIRARFHLDGRYIFFLGTVEPRKNIRGLIHAFSRYVRDHRGTADDLTLAIAGAKGWKSEEIFEELDRANDVIEKATGRRPIRYLGYVTIEEKWALMRYARAFVFPSLYEGFGLAVLEAMSVGTPVVASNRTALAEIVGTGGVLIDPEFTNEIYHGMGRLLSDDAARTKFSEAGKQRAAHFSWDKAAKDTLQTLHKALMGA